MNQTPVCRCEFFEHPRRIVNPPGQDAILYRIGDFVSFRHALLQALPGEVELPYWRPGSQGDLAVQMVEWWAYLADILTFYNERIANEDYLRTALLPESIQRLIRVLGYRPRPGIGATGKVAALLTSSKPVQLTPGFQIKSKPGPGKQPQTFELDAAVTVTQPDSVAALPPPTDILFQAGNSVLLKGAVSVKPGTELLIVAGDWDGSDNRYAVVQALSAQQEKDALGKPNTRLVLRTLKSGIPNGAAASDYQILESRQTAHLYPFNADTVIGDTEAHLDSLARDISAGQLVLFDVSSGGSGLSATAPHATFTLKSKQSGAKLHAKAIHIGPISPALVKVTLYEELVWYVNTTSSADPTQAPDPKTTIPIPVPHTVLTFTPAVSSNFNFRSAEVTVRHGFAAIGELIGQPAAALTDSSPATLTAIAPGKFPAGNGQKVQIEGAAGNGVDATGSVGVDLTQMALSEIHGKFNLPAPLGVLFDLLPVSRGETVANEILGNGDAAAENQEFVLQKSPLTYLLDPDSSSGTTYRSTLSVWVDNVAWKEAPSFFNQAADARVFVTREDEKQKTHVLFGDGINGARLPSGLNNVTARYRFGSGKDAPDAGTLTVIAKPLPGLKKIRNPVAVGGGDDPDPPQKVRRYAPRSVLAFGRAVSVGDYEAIASQTPGVSRARAIWGWDDSQQRTLVTVYVGDDEPARKAAATALLGAGDPNRPVQVLLATAVPASLTLSIEIAADRLPGPVTAGVTAALTDPDRGLFGLANVRIGEAIYQSQIYEACLNVPGAIAVHSLQFSSDRGSGFALETGFRFDPGDGGFFQMDPAVLTVNAEALSDAG